MVKKIISTLLILFATLYSFGKEKNKLEINLLNNFIPKVKYSEQGSHNFVPTNSIGWGFELGIRSKLSDKFSLVYALGAEVYSYRVNSWVTLDVPFPEANGNKMNVFYTNYYFSVYGQVGIAYQLNNFFNSRLLISARIGYLPPMGLGSGFSIQGNNHTSYQIYKAYFDISRSLKFLLLFRYEAPIYRKINIILGMNSYFSTVGHGNFKFSNVQMESMGTFKTRPYYFNLGISIKL